MGVAGWAGPAGRRSCCLGGLLVGVGPGQARGHASKISRPAGQELGPADMGEGVGGGGVGGPEKFWAEKGQAKILFGTEI